ncbi:MAG: SusC/RagA family TonB-linked outer membrane protein [Saprospiraceae bacterium]
MIKSLLMGTSRFLGLLILLFLSVQLTAQQTITGKIVDEEGVELIGVSILAQGTGIGTASEPDGTYRINVPSGVNILVFSYTGYVSQEIDITGKSSLDVVLASDTEILEEVVVVGYGRQKKSVVTGAISSIKMDEIQNLSAGQVQSAIQGRVAGISILPTSGSPGAGFKVRVRGTGSNGNADPLYIVDGMRTRDISFITAEEIESMEVLKDAASAAIYGSEGGNGVVIVTTKTGGSKNAGFTYSAQYGTQRYNGNLDLMSADQHAEYMVEAGIGGRTPEDVTNNTDWLDEVFESATLQRHALSFEGGDEKLSYFLNGSFFNQNGIVVGDRDNFKRYSIRANITNQVKPWLKLGARINYAHSQRKGISEDNEFGGILSNSILMDPNTPVTYSGETPQFVQDLAASGADLLRDDNNNLYGLSEFVAGEIFNPIAALTLDNGQGSTNDRIIGSVFAEAQIIDGLKVTTRFGVDNDFGNFHLWTPSFYFTGTRQSNAATVIQNQFRSTRWQWENYVTYEKDFGKHTISGLVGTSLFSNDVIFVNASGTGLIKENDAFGFLNSVQPGVEFTTAGGGAAQNTLSSVFGRISYDFADKYLLSVTLRRDGSSLLADGQQWGTFPSVSTGWVMSKEDFFPTSKVFNFAKLRVSWGQNGSLSNLSPGAWRSAIGFGGAYPDADGNLQVTASPTILSNPELTWETSEQIDIGLDLGFFEDRLSVTFDYFNKKTKDLLITGIIPSFVGNAAPTVNLGDISNRGFEIEVAYRNRIGEFGYDIAANFTKLTNEVTALDENLDFAGGTQVGVGWTATAFEQGLPAWYFRGYKTDGILQSEAEAAAYANQFGLLDTDGNPTVQAGDPRVIDTNEDNTITPDDQTFIGSPHPDALYGLRLGLDYKGFDFTFFIQGVSGNDILLGYNRTDRATSNKPDFFYTDRWTEGSGNNDFFRANGDNALAYNSDYMVFDGSYARIKQIQLGYNFSSKLLTFARQGRVYVSLEDIATFTNYKGLDPETGSNNDQSIGIDRGVYPLPAKILFGLSISL